MKNRVVWRGLVVVGVALPIVGAQHAAPLQSTMPGTALSPQDSAFHALNRLAYGPRPGDVLRVAAGGVLRWIDRQLSPDGINVYFAKGADRFLTPDYIEHTIRPRAMGKFEDLLIATAKSPAMLFYLDNWESVAPGASPQSPLSARRRGGQGVRRMPKGINENYARELLELHTLGVDGGYTQHDVIDVARIFTGWSMWRPQQGGDFEFHGWAHDRV